MLTAFKLKERKRRRTMFSPKIWELMHVLITIQSNSVMKCTWGILWARDFGWMTPLFILTGGDEAKKK